MTILILGNDDHAEHMLQHLHATGADAELLDSRWHPTQLAISFDPISNTGSLVLPAGRTLDFQQITSVYWRAYQGVGEVELADPEQAFIAANDSRSLFESLLICIRTRWVNGWTAFQLHQTKPVQLSRVAALGVPTAATIISNDPRRVREFAGRYPKSIFKPVQGGAHTRRLTAQHLTDENLRNLAAAPVTVQEEVPGTNVRVFVAGDRVLSCEIGTNELDFRDDPDPHIVPHSLPAPVEASCLEIAQTLHLLWTGIDFRLTDDGRYIFLEANPSPMFLGFESRTGLPLTEALGQLLVPR